VAVFDFGGGTLDIAVLRAEQNGDFSVVAAKGDNTLGGRTIDNVLYRWVLDQVEHNDPDTADELKSAEVSVMHSLDQSIREAKEMLSDTSSATITVSTPRGEHDFLITRDEFNTLIDKVVGRAVELTQAALSQAGVDKSTPIYMTGGSSRIPYVQNRLGEVGTVMTLDDPKTVVARGALAATMMGFTEGSGQVTATKSQQPNNPFGVGPGTVGAAQAASQGRQGGGQGENTDEHRHGGQRPQAHPADIAHPAPVVSHTDGQQEVQDAPQEVERPHRGLLIGASQQRRQGGDEDDRPEDGEDADQDPPPPVCGTAGVLNRAYR